MSTWFRFDDAMPDHPKVLGLTDRAFRVHVEAWAYCSRMGNGGELPTVAGKRLHRFTSSVATELVKAGLWEATDGGWKVHGWQDRQRTADEIAAIREARRKAGQAGGLRSGEVRGGRAAG